MSTTFWKNIRVLVTGGTGFIGSHVVEKLVNHQARVTVLDNLQNGKIKNIAYLNDQVRFIHGDCTDPATAQEACADQDIVMNLAARVGGIEYNRTHQATMLHDNLLIETMMIESARKANVGRFLVVSSACVYPRTCSIPTPEQEGFKEEPEPTNGGYGWAKRVGELLGNYYHEQFGMQVAVVRPYNCYGPRDHFDPATSHVIPALIKRVVDGENPIIVWGSGTQSRAFLYVEDLADGMLAALEHGTDAAPINLGTDEEVTIAELIHKILAITGKKSKVMFDKTKPDGSPRRNSDNRLAQKKLKFTAQTRLDEGLKKTIDWYLQNSKSSG